MIKSVFPDFTIRGDMVQAINCLEVELENLNIEGASGWAGANLYGARGILVAAGRIYDRDSLLARAQRAGMPDELLALIKALPPSWQNDTKGGLR